LKSTDAALKVPSDNTCDHVVAVDLAAYPMLAWRWYIELPIRSPLDEHTHTASISYFAYVRLEPR
jgi:hypothetical protein